MHESVSAADSGFAGGPLQKAHQPMSEWSTMTPNDQLEARIKELGDKSTQILIFLSFALVVVAALRSNPALGLEQKTALVAAMRWWMRAVWPVLLGIVPLKEFRENSRTWYRTVRITKVVLLWLAAIFILLGLYRFAYGI